VTLGGAKHTLIPPTYFQGVKTPQPPPPGSTPLQMQSIEYRPWVLAAHRARCTIVSRFQVILVISPVQPRRQSFLKYRTKPTYQLHGRVHNCLPNAASRLSHFAIASCVKKNGTLLRLYTVIIDRNRKIGSGVIIIIIIIRSRRQQRSVASTQSGHDDEPWTIRHEC